MDPQICRRADVVFPVINKQCIRGHESIFIKQRHINLGIRLNLVHLIGHHAAVEQTEEIKALKEKLGLPLDKKVILYAPTWRDSNDGGQSYSLRPPMNMDYWQQQLESEFVMLFRMHAYTNKVMGLTYNDFMRDVSEYPSINDLMKVSDILISDYSACIVDYSILERPIICFAYDYEEYSRTRGVNLDFEKEMPSGVKRTEQEVINHIKNMNYLAECEHTKSFKNKYTYIGGQATQICVETLFGK